MKTLVRVTVLTVAVSAIGSTAGHAQLNSSPMKFGIKMADNVYSKKALKVRKGEAISFVFSNSGKLVHEAVVGTRAEQVAHEKEMVAMGGMAMADEPNAIQVKPGKSKTLTYTFAKAGAYEIGCHIPSHYKAGMKIDVIVS